MYESVVGKADNKKLHKTLNVLHEYAGMPLSVSQIAAKAGVYPGTAYSHLKHLDAMLSRSRENGRWLYWVGERQQTL